ncbi:hypothetical protein GCM10008961_18570 [Deinococcus knuensis]|uniref:Uncharacterized protein n=2 Tax=Deinococcus knuensis TaxID=1837380 RepID=A0ABQ2SIE6_9DEIO|nr:hypothetical protein GCM10008961_18570 [Deinococcus knuensis]
MNYANQIMIKSGKVIVLKNSGYAVEDFDAFLESIRTSLGKQQAFLKLRKKGRDLLLEGTNPKKWRQSDESFRKLVEEYDSLPVRYGANREGGDD